MVHVDTGDDPERRAFEMRVRFRHAQPSAGLLRFAGQRMGEAARGSQRLHSI
jgi:hypothetical protein